MKSEGFIFKNTRNFCVQSWPIIHTIPKNFKTATKKIFSPYSPIKLTWPSNITPHSKISKPFQKKLKRSPKKNILTRIPYKTNLAQKIYATLEISQTIPKISKRCGKIFSPESLVKLIWPKNVTPHSKMPRFLPRNAPPPRQAPPRAQCPAPPPGHA